MAKRKDIPKSGVVVRKSYEREKNRKEIESAVMGVLTKSAPKNANGGILAGILGADGVFRSSSTLAKGLKVTQKGMKPTFSLNLPGNKPEEGVFAYPQAIQDDDQKLQHTHDRDGTIPPPWSFPLLKQMFISNEMHYSCIDTKASDVTGAPFDLVLTAEAKLAGYKMEDTEVRDAYNEAMQFLSCCSMSPKSPLSLPVTTVLKEAFVDHEALGMLAFEVLRNGKGFVGGLSTIPGHTLAALTAKESDYRNGCTYLQRRSSTRCYFLPYMGSVEFPGNAGFNPLNATIDQFPKYSERAKFMQRKAELPAARFGEELTDRFEDAATELFVLQRAPMTLSTVYGTPAAVSAFPAILGISYLDDYNANFFTSKGIPQFAVIVEGLTPPAVNEGTDTSDENDPTVMMEALVREFFEENLEKAKRGVLVMSTFGTATVKFEKLSAEQVEGSFDKLEARYNERIRLAHQIPPAALGIGESSTLGASKGAGNGRELSQMQRYRDHIVSPNQLQMGAIIRSILRGGLLIPFFDVVFQPLAIDEEVMQRTFLLDEFREGGLTPNEYRLASSKYANDDRPAIGKTDDAANPANWLFMRNAQTTMISPDGIQTTAPGDTPNQSGKPTEGTREKPSKPDQTKVLPPK